MALFQRFQSCNLPIRWGRTVGRDQWARRYTVAGSESGPLLTFFIYAGKGMTTSYHVEIREDIIYNQLPLEEHYIYQTLEQGTMSLISERLDGYWRDLETGCLDQPLRFLRSIQSVLHGHAQKACRHNSFLPKK